MTEEDKWQYLVELDERLLQGGVILSEWATFLIKDADTAFVGGAHLASITTALAGVETHLRAEGEQTGTGPVYERPARMAVRGTPHKVTQRGTNAADMFFLDREQRHENGACPHFPHFPHFPFFSGALGYRLYFLRELRARNPESFSVLTIPCPCRGNIKALS